MGPFFARLTKFYLAIASIHKKGGFATPEDTGESMLFYLIHYPYPLFPPAKFGNLELADDKYLTLLRRANADWIGSFEARRRYRWSQGNLPTDPFAAYMQEVKCALIGFTAGCNCCSTGRISLARKGEAFIDKLQGLIKENGKDTALYQFALLGPLAVQKKNAKVMELLKAICEVSPFLAVRASAFASVISEDNKKLQKMIARYSQNLPPRSRPLPRFCQWVNQRLDEPWFTQRFEKNVAQVCLKQLPSLYRIFLQQETYEETLDNLKIDLTTDHTPKELLARATRLFSYQMNRKHLGFLTKVTKKNRQSGLMLDAISDLLKTNPPRHSSSPWIHKALQVFYTAKERPSLRSIQSALEKIDWNAPNIDEQIASIYEAHGRLATTLYLADRLEERGQPKLAQRYRNKVTRFYSLVSHHYQRYEEQKWSSAAWACWHGLANLSSSKATSDLALALGERYYAACRGKAWDSSYLYKAQAHLHLSQLKEAAESLVASYDKKVDRQLAYFYDNRVGNDTFEYRQWLFQAIGTHPKSNKEVLSTLNSQQLCLDYPDIATDLFGKDADTGVDDTEELF